MVKTIVSLICVSLILLGGAIWEGYYIKNEFDDLHSSLEIVYEKVDDQTATIDDIYSLQKVWLKKKKTLHMIVPHTELKEMDLWIAETATLVRDKEWKDAISKIEVLLELTEQIPQTFTIQFSNIF